MECPGRYLGLSRKKFKEDWEYWIKKSFLICVSHHAVLFFSDQNRTDNQGGACSMQREKITLCKFLVGSPEENIFQ
jgi:hypothetical protein